MSYRLIRILAAASLPVLVLGTLGCGGGKAPPPQMPPPKVTVAKPVVYPVQSYYEYNGYLDSVEKFEAKARVKGFLTEVKFTEGEEVKTGALLYTIDPREYEANFAKSVADIQKAKADIANAKAQIKLADAEQVRAEEAYNRGAAAKTDLDKANATVAANRAQLDVGIANQAAAEAARDAAKLQLDFTEIRSPIDGRISRTLVTKGNLVGQTEATLLTTVVSMDPLYVYFDVPERDLVAYQHARQEGAANPARTLTVEIGVATEEGFPHKGFIDFRENRVDTGTGTVRIRARVPNPVDPKSHTRLLYPGLFSRVRVPVGQEKNLPVIPEDVLMTGQEGRFLYIVGPDNKVMKRTVTVGTQIYRAPPPDNGKKPTWMLTNPNPSPPPPPGTPGAGGPPAPTKIVVQSLVAIERGLTPNDVVIVNGIQKARPGGEVAPEVWQLIGPPAPTAGAAAEAPGVPPAPPK